MNNLNYVEALESCPDCLDGTMRSHTTVISKKPGKITSRVVRKCDVCDFVKDEWDEVMTTMPCAPEQLVWIDNKPSTGKRAATPGPSGPHPEGSA